MKKIFLILSVLFVFGCQTQEPVSQAPVYNITLTDNSQWVVGDNNATESNPETKSEQSAEPSVDARAEENKSNMWIFWLILLCVGCVGGYFAYIKWIKK